MLTVADRDETSRTSQSERIHQIMNAESEQEREMCRDFDCQWENDRLRVFQYDNSQFLDIGDMAVQRHPCGAMCWSAERIVSSSETFPKFPTSVRKRGVHQLSFLIPLPYFSSSRARDRRFR